MWRVAGEALESHNPSGTPLPTTDQEARFWMRVNGFVSEGDGSFHFPGVTPHKNRSWPSDDKVSLIALTDGSHVLTHVHRP